MKMSFLKCILPPFIVERIRSFRSPWSGDYSTWSEALRECEGYDSEKIIESVFKAAEKVKDGYFPYERDSVLFESTVYSWPLATVLCWAAISEKRVRVVDFGGGLGSSFYQNKIFLDNMVDVQWNIIEQEKIVKIGRSEFETKSLSFYDSVESLQSKTDIDLVLVSSTLQYLEFPYNTLEQLLELKPKFILLDRLTVTNSNRELITKQSVRDFSYRSSYPCRIFVQDKIIEFVTRNNQYKLISIFDSYVANKGIINQKHQYNDIGLLFKRNDA